MKSKSRSITGLLTAAMLLIGIAQMAVMPPFEGFDEVAHYSSIRQVAETGTIPLMRHSFISPEVIEYRQYGPMPFHVPITHTTKPITHGEGEIISYAEFFAKPENAEIYQSRYRVASARAPYEPVTEEFNWEAQHPPLYYIVMAPVMKATDALPFVTQFFILRLVSFLIACAGFWLAMRATLEFAGKTMPGDYMRAGFMLYPLVLPMFYLEFARIANDCLCLFFFGAVWNFTLQWLRGQRGAIFNIAFGLALGLGLLTKTLFLPVAAGFGLLALVHMWRLKNWQPLRGLFVIFLLAVIVGGSWYVTQKVLNGSMSGSFNTIMLEKQGGLIAGLHENFSIPRLLREVGFFFISWSWLFSQSNTYIGPALHAPVFLLLGWLLFGYARKLRNIAVTKDIWTPVYYVAPFVAALGWYTIICIAVGWDHSPGWYLHVLAPAIAVILGYGLQQIAEDKEQRFILGLFLAYCVAFLAIVNWAQASLFAGCAVHDSAEGHYVFPDGAFCLNRLPQIANNLGVTGWPWLALLAYTGGFACLLLGLYRVRTSLLRAGKTRNA